MSDDNEEIMSDNPDIEVQCPHCGATWQDVHEYFMRDPHEESHTDCISCGKSIIIRAEYEVTYYTRKGT